ncbi:AMP-binding protein [Pseudoalteromonas sp. KG3]|uniref:AMP-binding protein n=1 Tax=Pseudoalteromonas sp. KG3 TaxID=2951137 RepID=UPI002658DE7D|nr:AMP-binding protein [Pseudoalteromonas sp. KG3]WKD26120.1 AMP-binding protein [Pseudoalteromonas sp. KG3]
MKWPINNNFFYCEQQSFVIWQQQVIAHAELFAEQPAQTWLLFDADSYRFSVLFFALLVAKKSVILPQNGQPEQLAQCLEYADEFTGDTDLLPTKVLFSHDLTCNSLQALDIDEHSIIRFFTSGSTGAPKAIDKTFKQLVQEIQVLEAQFGANLNSSLFVATVSHQHIYGLLFKLLWPLYSGYDVCLQSFEYPEHLLHFIDNSTAQAGKAGFTLISSPAYYHRLVQDNVLAPVKNKFRGCFSSGGPLQAIAAKLLTEQLAMSPIEVLGSTETGGIAWRQQSHSSSWQAFKPIKIKLDDTQHLIISSPYVVEANWYRTDDRAQLLESGQFTLLGRADRIVKIEEKRCSLDEISQRIIEHSWVDECYVLLLESQQQHKRNEIAAVLVLTPAGEIAVTELGKFKFSQTLKSHLKAFFEPLVIPRKFRYLPALPYNRQGKLEKAQLEKMFD